MKIKPNELPRKNFSQVGYLRSLAKAINNHRDGDYKDCCFSSEEDFYDYLCTLEKCGVVCKKQSCLNKKPSNLNHYMCIEDPIVKFGSSNKFLSWLKINAVPLLNTAFVALRNFK